MEREKRQLIFNRFHYLFKCVGFERHELFCFHARVLYVSLLFESIRFAQIQIACSVCFAFWFGAHFLGMRKILTQCKESRNGNKQRLGGFLLPERKTTFQWLQRLKLFTKIYYFAVYEIQFWSGKKLKWFFLSNWSEISTFFDTIDCNKFWNVLLQHLCAMCVNRKCHLRDSKVALSPSPSSSYVNLRIQMNVVKIRCISLVFCFFSIRVIKLGNC